MEELLALYASHQWLALIVLVLAYLTRITASDSKFPISIPSRWRPLVVLVLGQAYAVTVAVQQGERWQTALIHGVVIALTTMGAFDVVMHSLFNGDEPAWLKALAGVPAGLAQTVDVHSVPVGKGAMDVVVEKGAEAKDYPAAVVVTKEEDHK